MFQLLVKRADLKQIEKMLLIIEGEGSTDKFASLATPLKIKILTGSDRTTLYEQILKEAV